MNQQRQMENEYVTVRELSQRYPVFSEGSLRWMIFKNQNEFRKNCKKIGRKIFVDLNAFKQWIENLPSGEGYGK